jgi:hypothetical protein
MTTPVLALALLALAQAGQGAGAEPTGRGPAWRTYTAKKGDFSVKLPAKPDERDQHGMGQFGQLDVHVVILQVEDVVYAAYYHDNPPIPEASREAYLVNMRDGTVRSHGGELLSEKRIVLGPHPGREFSMRAPMDAAVDVTPTKPGQRKAERKIRLTVNYKIRMYLVGDRLYQLIAVAPVGNPFDREAETYLSSFRLTSGEPAPEPPAAGVSASWKPFESSDGAVRINLPGTPDETEETIDTAPRPRKIHRVVATAEPSSYTVRYEDCDPAAVRDPKSLLDFHRDEILAQSRGRLVREQKISLARQPGRELEIEAPGANDAGPDLLRCRVYLVRSRVYVVVARFPKDKPPRDDLKAFFSSFKATSRSR